MAVLEAGTCMTMSSRSATANYALYPRAIDGEQLLRRVRPYVSPLALILLTSILLSYAFEHIVGKAIRTPIDYRVFRGMANSGRSYEYWICMNGILKTIAFVRIRVVTPHQVASWSTKSYPLVPRGESVNTLLPYHFIKLIQRPKHS